ncbi:MAG: aminotransferase class IV [Bacteroidales bacterium]|nr:aminotransferase class IV [Bacteroidales bacterium]
MNGEIYPCSEFIGENLKMGTSFYEVLRVIDGKPVFFPDHLARLRNSLVLAGKEIGFDEEKTKTLTLKFLHEEQLKNGNIKIITHFNDNSEHSLYIHQIPHYYPSSREYSDGVPVGIFQAKRLNPNIKYIDVNLRNTINEKIKQDKVLNYCS